MTSKSNARTGHWLLAGGLALGVVTAKAPNGVAPVESQIGRLDLEAQERAPKVGMNPTEILQILGRPDYIIKDPIAPGPTWVYHRVESPFTMSDFGVNFGSDDKVAHFGRRTY